MQPDSVQSYTNNLKSKTMIVASITPLFKDDSIVQANFRSTPILPTSCQGELSIINYPAHWRVPNANSNSVMAILSFGNAVWWPVDPSNNFTFDSKLSRNVCFCYTASDDVTQWEEYIVYCFLCHCHLLSKRDRWQIWFSKQCPFYVSSHPRLQESWCQHVSIQVRIVNEMHIWITC